MEGVCWSPVHFYLVRTWECVHAQGCLNHNADGPCYNPYRHVCTSTVKRTQGTDWIKATRHICFCWQWLTLLNMCSIVSVIWGQQCCMVPNRILGCQLSVFTWSDEGESNLKVSRMAAVKHAWINNTRYIQRVSAVSLDRCCWLNFQVVCMDTSRIFIPDTSWDVGF